MFGGSPGEDSRPPPAAGLVVQGLLYRLSVNHLYGIPALTASVVPAGTRARPRPRGPRIWRTAWRGSPSLLKITGDTQGSSVTRS